MAHQTCSINESEIPPALGSHALQGGHNGKFMLGIFLKVRELRSREGRSGRVFQRNNLSPLQWDWMSKSTWKFSLVLPACIRDWKTSPNKASDNSHHHFKPGWPEWLGVHAHTYMPHLHARGYIYIFPVACQQIMFNSQPKCKLLFSQSRKHIRMQ